jgi:hypothetical protein
LQTLALAYPANARVVVQDTRYSSNTTEISAVAVESYSDVVIVLKGV